MSIESIRSWHVAFGVHIGSPCFGKLHCRHIAKHSCYMGRAYGGLKRVGWDTGGSCYVRVLFFLFLWGGWVSRHVLIL